MRHVVCHLELAPPEDLILRRQHVDVGIQPLLDHRDEERLALSRLLEPNLALRELVGVQLEEATRGELDALPQVEAGGLVQPCHAEGCVGRVQELLLVRIVREILIGRTVCVWILMMTCECEQGGEVARGVKSREKGTKGEEEGG